MFIYYTMATWNPYTVLKMRSAFSIMPVIDPTSLVKSKKKFSFAWTRADEYHLPGGLLNQLADGLGNLHQSHHFNQRHFQFHRRRHEQRRLRHHQVLPTAKLTVMKPVASILFAIAGGLAIWLCGVGSTFSQSLPNLSANENTNGKLHIVWPVPTVGSILQQASSLASTGAWQASPLNIITSGCNCQVLAPTAGTANFYRLASTNPPPVGIYLGQPTQLLTSNQFGMTDVPDMHTAILQQSNIYRLWIAGRFENDTVEGATGLLVTTNFTNFTSGDSLGTTNVLPVLIPSCRGSNFVVADTTNFDADYAGADFVWTATNGTDLLMLYHGETWAFGTNAPNNHSPGWASVGLARSSDGGITWTNRQQIITSSDPVPTNNPPVAQIYGAVEPGAIIASNFIYCYYAYFPSTPATNPAGPVIHVARSALTNDGASNTWSSITTMLSTRRAWAVKVRKLARIFAVARARRSRGRCSAPISTPTSWYFSRTRAGSFPPQRTW